jgi:murein DD-endopeptidase MepM/ murein hydrolase activator NlpD
MEIPGLIRRSLTRCRQLASAFVATLSFVTGSATLRQTLRRKIVAERIDDLASSHARFMTHRIARRAVIAVTLAASACALTSGIAGGIAIGRFSRASQSIHASAGANLPHHAVAGEIARPDAQTALLDARIDRLAAQLAELQQFDERLRAHSPSTNPLALAHDHRGAAAEEADGGPELPPQRCAEQPSANAGEQQAQSGLECATTTLAALEQAVAAYEARWQAFPGRWPVARGHLGSPFGNRIDPFTRRRSFHPGVDLVAPIGTPILAAARGRVIYAGPKKGYGNTVEIDHGYGFITRYGHASKLDVRVGELVEPNQHIADVGSTGRSTGPHLHFEVIVAGAPVNPTGYLALFQTVRRETAPNAA